MKRVLGWFGLALGLAIFSGIALADEASDYMAAAGDEAKAYGDCTADFAKPLTKSTDSPEQIADEAIAACRSKAGAVKVALMGPKLKLTEERADEAVSTVTAALRENLINLITKARQ